MKPFIKMGNGDGSWTTTLVVLFFVFYISVYYIGIFTTGTIAEYAQSAWGKLDMIFIALVVTYCVRRGTEVYERLRNGATAVTDIVSTMQKDDEKSDDSDPT